MTNPTNTKVISYVADIKSVEHDLARMGKLNAKLAKTMGSEFGNVAQVIKSNFAKTAKIKVIDKDGIEKTISAMDRLNTVVKTTTGHYFQISESATKLSNSNKKVATSVTDVTAKYDKQAKAQTKITKETSKLATMLNSASDINAKYSSNLKGVGLVTKVLARDIPQASGNIQKMGATVKTADGKILHLRETITRLPGGLQKVDRHVSNVSTSFNAVKKTAQSFGKATATLGENIGRLAKRAALTIPLWLALRGSFMGVISGIKGGFKDIVAFDKSLQKLQKNLQGTPQEISKNFTQAKQSITDFAIASGKSTEDITKAIQRFATVGFDFETAMEAGVNATKLATILFGDAEKTANAFARSMNVLIDKTDETRNASEQIAGAMALTSELYEINAFEVDELSAGLQKFAGTAKALNLTTEQTITLMGALSSQGLNPKRANIMRSSFLKLASSLDEVADKLGIDINPKLDTTFDVFRRVIGALASLKNESGKISPELFESVRDIFNIRGGEVALDFVAGFEEVNAQLNKFLAAKPDIGKFHQDFEDMNDTVFRQVEIFDNLKKEVGKAFVTGLVGGKDFQTSLEKINVVLNDMLPKMLGFGGAIRDMSVATKKAVTPLLQLVELMIAIPSLGVIPMTKEMLNLADATKKAQKLLENAQETAREFGTSLNEALSGKLDVSDLNRVIDGLITRIRIPDLDTSIEQGILFKSLTELLKNESGKLRAVDLLNIEAKLEGLETKKINKAVFDDLRSMTRAKAEEAFAKNPLEIDVPVDAKIDINRKVKAEELLKSELKTLKTQGATQSQLLKVEKSYVKILGLSRDEDSVLRKKLELERAIGEEKRLQSNLGADSIKLAEIAQSEDGGMNVARQIGRLLEGEISYDVFRAMGGKAYEVFKEEFSGREQQQQAEKFLLRGRGRSIPIAERGLRQDEITRATAGFESKVQQLRLDTKVDIDVQAKLDPSNMADFANEVGKQVANKLKTKGTELNDSLNQGINYDTLRRDL